MCPREDIDYQGSQLQELKAELESQLIEVKSDLESKLVEVQNVSRSLEEKLDAVLRKLGEKDTKQRNESTQNQRTNKCPA